MNITAVMERIKSRADYEKIGMILCHHGIVRATSRDGRRVKGLRVSVDHRKLEQILSEKKRKQGIIDIQVEIAEDRDLAVGDQVMLLVVAGDFRENVIAVLTETLETIKTSVTKKTEFFV
jgi:molybdopterin synthase catalytic subunit